MPKLSSAKKALRQNIRRRARNLAVKRAIKDAGKNFRNAIASKKNEEARILLSALYKLLDKAAKTGLIKKNSAARKKSRFAKNIR